MARTSKPVAPLRNSTRGEVAIQEFANSNSTPEQLRQRAAPLLNNKELLRSVLGLTPEDQTKFVDKVDQAYSTVDPQNAKFVTALGDVCSAIERLPTPAVLSAGLEKRGNIAVASGGLTDVWRGRFNGIQVAIKAFRIYPAQNLKEAKEILWRRVPIWRKLSHENILSFRGVNMTLFQLALVYDWGQNGNISQYMASHPGASRPALLLGVAKGLRYLHSVDIPHGDLKGANVVVDEKGCARVTEYGLTPINSDPKFAVGLVTYPAPEELNSPGQGNGMPLMESKAADVFAFAMFAVEVFTGKIPFHEQKNEAVVLQISRGGRPVMPANAQTVGLTGEMWKVLESCWQRDPKTRPTMEDVVRRWETFVEHEDNNDIITKKRQPTAELAGRLGAKTEAFQFPPRMKTAAARSRTMSEGVQSRTVSETPRPRTMSEAFQPGIKLETVDPQARPRAVQPQTQSAPPRPTPERRKRWFCGLF